MHPRLRDWLDHGRAWTHQGAGARSQRTALCEL